MFHTPPNATANGKCFQLSRTVEGNYVPGSSGVVASMNGALLRCDVALLQCTHARVLAVLLLLLLLRLLLLLLLLLLLHLSAEHSLVHDAYAHSRTRTRVRACTDSRMRSRKRTCHGNDATNAHMGVGWVAGFVQGAWGVRLLTATQDAAVRHSTFYDLMSGGAVAVGDAMLTHNVADPNQQMARIVVEVCLLNALRACVSACVLVCTCMCVRACMV